MMFVGAEGDFLRHGKTFQNSVAQGCMSPYHLKLFVRQSTIFQVDRVWQFEHADVVQHRRNTQFNHPVRGQLHKLPDRQRQDRGIDAVGVHIVLGGEDKLRIAEHGIPAGFYPVYQQLDPLAQPRNVQPVLLLELFEGFQGEVDQGIVELLRLLHLLFFLDVYVQNGGSRGRGACVGVGGSLGDLSVAQYGFITPTFQPLDQLFCYSGIGREEDKGFIQIHGGIDIAVLLKF